MKFDKKYIIPFIIAAFLLWLPFYQGDSHTAIEQMQEALTPIISADMYHPLDEKELRKYFNIEKEEIDGFIAYRSNDTMSAETLLILRYHKQSDPVVIKQKVMNYIDNEHKKYDGYSPDQVRILEDYNIQDTKGYLFLSIGDHPEWKQTFKDQL